MDDVQGNPSIKKMPVSKSSPAANAQELRPFQPGGSLIAAPASDASRIQSVERDIAFGRQLESLLPTLMGARIDTPAKAKQARAKLLDLAQGSDLGGANTKPLNLRKSPTGVKYPLWSASSCV